MIGLCLLSAGCATGIADDDRVFNLTPKPAEAAGFVRESRPASLDYISVAPPQETGKIPIKSKEQLTQAEADLAAKAARNTSAATRGRPRSPYDGRIEPGYRAPRPRPVSDDTWKGLKANPPVRSLRKSTTAE